MGGSVQVESVVKKFTKFNIRMNTLCKIKDFKNIQNLFYEDPVLSEKSHLQIEQIKHLLTEKKKSASKSVMSSKLPRLLIVNDNYYLLEGYVELLKDYFSVDSAINGFAALEMV